MIIVDTCIISSLAKIQRLTLLRSFSDVRTTSGVIEESVRLEDMRIIGPLCIALKDWMKTIPFHDDRGIKEIRKKFPELSNVDCELILTCRQEKAVLFSDDGSLLYRSNVSFDIVTWDLKDILEASHSRGILSTPGMRKMVHDLKKEDKYSFSQDDLGSLGV